MSYTGAMATNGKIPYGYETPAVAKRRDQPTAAPKASVHGKGVIAAAVFMFAALGVMFVFIAPRLKPYDIDSSKAKLEVKQLGDLMAALEALPSDPAKADVLMGESVRDERGEGFYEALLKQGLLDDALLSKLVSLNSKTDAKADKSWLDEPSRRMPDNACSYTGPVARALVDVMGLKGDDRAVLITFNARNWNNYPNHGIVVFWTDADAAEFLPFEYFEANYGITEKEWADPAGKLFGKKAPFQYTYE